MSRPHLFALSVIALLLVNGLAAAETGTPDVSEDPAKPKLDFYGYLKLDAAFDTALVDTGNFARWVESPDVFESHSHFNLTARQTRLGLRFTGRRTERFRLAGKVEIDFYGGGDENKNRLQMRHGFVELTWPQRGHSVIAGQTSDLISPLVPSTINYTVAWWVGNIGYRRPQVRFTHRATNASGSGFVAAVAATRTIGDDFGLEPGDSGADSGVPSIQGRVGYGWKQGDDRKAELGLWGHWGEEHLHRDVSPVDAKLDSWSLGFDLKLPLGERVTLQAEGWTGANLDDYFGGIGQGINFDSLEEIESAGGWVAVDFKPQDDLTLSLGAGIDDPDDEDLEGGSRSKNVAVWGNMVYSILPELALGIELSYWDTDYNTFASGDAGRLQTALIYRF
ncbi:MAG: hypothetical protein JSV80_04220 [Acidobacteriota bacterium]|nr:MAG: hypothetical protein JSV80_04220 [Acidobacteriota bacterium]